MSGAHEDAAAMSEVARAVTSERALEALTSDPGFTAAAFALVDAWAPQPDDDADISRKLRDVGAYLAAIWAMQLAAQPAGLSASSLAGLMQLTGHSSRNRAIALLTYLRFLNFVAPLPQGVDGRNLRDRLYAPTPALRALFMQRFRRELAIVRPVLPEVGPCLDRWDEPGVADAYAVATGRYLGGALLVYDRDGENLDVFSTRNGGLTVLGQLVVASAERETFPPSGPVRISVLDLARRAGAGRTQARAILQAGEKAGFLRDIGDGAIAFSDTLREHLRFLVAANMLSMGWCAAQALAAVPENSAP